MNNTKNIFLISIIIVSYLRSDLASPEPFLVQQPNGEMITIYNRGNHLQGWHEYNGWTVTKDSDGWWVYAKGNNLLNENIRNSASFLRNYQPEPGIGVEVGIRLKY